MGNITIAALAGTVVQITQELAAFLWHCLIIVAVKFVLYRSEKDPPEG